MFNLLKSFLTKKKLYFAGFFFFSIQALFANTNNQLLNQLDSTATTLLADVVKVVGNIGMGIAVIALVCYLVGYMMNAERTKEYFKTAITIIIIGGVVKAISAMSIGTIF